ncbi:MAG: hypothetical protein JJ896_11095 [Rhodothermales bacterium]|nr:hypothetical protein [Rhodothermales bacterium]MBO6780187.1 hypothetical protein [Rhodothermales bacterium]
MFLIKGPLVWRSLAQLTRHLPDMPAWTLLEDLPLRQLGPKVVTPPRVFYMPEEIPAPRPRTWFRKAA